MSNSITFSLRLTFLQTSLSLFKFVQISALSEQIAQNDRKQTPREGGRLLYAGIWYNDDWRSTSARLWICMQK